MNYYYTLLLLRPVYKNTSKLLVCVTEQHYASIFLTLTLNYIYGLYALLFSYKGRLVTSKQKWHFFCLRLIYACRLVLYFTRMCGWESSNFRIKENKRAKNWSEREKHKHYSLCCFHTVYTFSFILCILLFWCVFFYKLKLTIFLSLSFFCFAFDKKFYIWLLNSTLN